MVRGVPAKRFLLGKVSRCHDKFVRDRSHGEAVEQQTVGRSGAPISHDGLVAMLDAIEVTAQSVLEISDTDFDR